MSWQILRPQIAALVQTIPEIQEVSSTPKIKFEGHPSVHVIPSDNSGDYETTSENERVYAFTVRAFYETKEGGVEAAFLGLEEVVDKIIDKFDLEDMKDSSSRIVGINLPANYTFLNIFAAPSRWGDLPEEELLMAEIVVRIRLSIDVTP
jgi:hypothetical protein